MTSKELAEKLLNIQNEIKVPKSSYNSFGKYSYRNVEAIQEAAKPICKKYGVVITVQDDLIPVGDRFYIKATATISDGSNEIKTTAFAREPDAQKGMSEAQITGSSSSYARKYALGGLLLLDDLKDDDADETPNVERKPKSEPARKPEPTHKPEPSGKADALAELAKMKGQDLGEIKTMIIKKYNKANISDLTDAEIEPIMKWLRGL